jgi:hypothetical protein
MREVVAFLEQVAPAEPVFYDGYYDSLFAFYVRAGDPGFCRQVVVGAKLLYASALMPGWLLEEFAKTQPEVINRLRTKGGCQWLAFEVSRRPQTLAPAQLLRDTIRWNTFKGRHLTLAQAITVQGLLSPGAAAPGMPQAAVLAKVASFDASALGPFKFVGYFPIAAPVAKGVEVYRLTIPVDRPDEVELAFPILGQGGHFRVRPIPSRGPCRHGGR